MADDSQDPDQQAGPPEGGAVNQDDIDALINQASGDQGAGVEGAAPSGADVPAPASPADAGAAPGDGGGAPDVTSTHSPDTATTSDTGTTARAAHAPDSAPAPGAAVTPDRAPADGASAPPDPSVPLAGGAASQADLDARLDASAAPDAADTSDAGGPGSVDPRAHAETTAAPTSGVAAVGAQALTLEELAAGESVSPDVKRVSMLNDVALRVQIELGRTRMRVEDVLQLDQGSVVELDKLAGDPVDVIVNDRLVARGEVLVLNDNFCVRINEVLTHDPHRVST